MERENLARREQQERERVIARARELEEEIRQREIIAREQAMEREILARREQQERERVITRVGELEEEIRQREIIARDQAREIENLGRREQQERERIIARTRELEEEILRTERIARDQAREIENLVRREQQERERIIARVREFEEKIRQKEQREIVTTARVRELEEIVIQKDENLVIANQRIQRLSGEIEHLNEQKSFEKKKKGINYSNLPKRVKEIFKNDKIQVFKRNENQPSELFNQFKNNKESKSRITQHLEDLMIKGKISIGCSDCLLWPDVLDYVSMICDVEKLVADKLEKQVKEDYEDFSEWNGDPDSVKLTLIFNIFGLSPETIEKFGPEVDGAVFDQDIFDLCSTYGIDDLGTILDLGYIQMIIRNNNLPCRNHFETCPVCCCSTPKDLEYLMREHNLDFDFDLLERKNINGRRFIANTRWVKKCGEKIDQKLFINAFRTLKKLHKIVD